jgi:hypothetical protein
VVMDGSEMGELVCDVRERTRVSLSVCLDDVCGVMASEVKPCVECGAERKRTKNNEQETPALHALLPMGIYPGICRAFLWSCPKGGEKNVVCCPPPPTAQVSTRCSRGFTASYHPVVD